MNPRVVDRKARERVATILRAKAAGILAHINGDRGRGDAREFTPGELLEMANALDPEHAVTLGAAMKGAQAG